MKLLIKRLFSYIPYSLPTGMTALTKYCNEVIELAGPLADHDSMLYVIVSEITALKPRQWVSQNYFIETMKSAAAKQIAGAIWSDIRQKAKDAQEAAKKASEQPVEVTTPPASVTPNGQETTEPKS